MPVPSMPTDRLSTVDEHVERIVEAIEPLPPYDQPLLEALNLPVCEHIVAPIDLPSFDNSAMDGYAVYHDDVATASEDHPVHLPVVGEVAAGQTTFFALSPGTAVRIMTGAPVPQGADAIVPVEWTDGGIANVRITRAPRRDEHVRHKGEDVQTGDVLLEEGTVLGPRQLGLLASVGRAQVKARPRPRVVVMSTGAELREPGTTLGHDSIYDANSYMIAAAARSAGAIAYRVGIVSDDAAAFRDALSDQLVRADLVVTSGGVSKGAYDVVRHDAGRIYGPGLGDNSMGVAALLHLALALEQADVANPGDIWFVANVGEEGLGDLRGMRAAVDRLGGQIGAAIALEGCDPNRIIHAGLGVRRYQISAAARGGHSWSDFGSPSAIHALVRLAAKLTQLDAPKQPRSSFNIGVIEGGSSVNTIAERAALLLDLRAAAPAALDTLIRQTEQIVADARDAEPGVTFEIETVGDRPAGSIPEQHALAQLAQAAYLAEGLGTNYEIASTDANIPLSRGIPAVCVGVCDGGNAHRLDEYIEPARLPSGMRALLWLALAATTE